MAEVEIREASEILQQLIDRAQAGEEIVITRDGNPVALLVPGERTSPMAAVRGASHGQVAIADDFDASIEGFTEAFEPG